MDNFDLRKYLAEGKLLKEETVVKEGLQVTTNDQLKKAVEDNKGSAAICKINSEQSPAPELQKLNGQFGIIENSAGNDGHFYAESVRMCQPEGADGFFVTSNVVKLPAVKGVGGGNGCDFSYFELVAVVGVTTNPKKIKSQGGGYEDNPNFDANAKDVRQIVKKY
jgi:hypothetical protein